MASVRISKDTQQEKIVVTFSYDPKLVTKVKSIEGHKWHPDKKHWSFPNTNGTFENILEHACEKADIKKDISVHTLRHSSLPPIYWRVERI